MLLYVIKWEPRVLSIRNAFESNEFQIVNLFLSPDSQQFTTIENELMRFLGEETMRFLGEETMRFLGEETISFQPYDLTFINYVSY